MCVYIYIYIYIGVCIDRSIQLLLREKREWKCLGGLYVFVVFPPGCCLDRDSLVQSVLAEFREPIFWVAYFPASRATAAASSPT